MLKSFREQNSNKETFDAIDQVVDHWIKELLKNMITSPMDPSAKRSLWDRFKGSLANIWYGGKYNPKNPYYWKHRFGDELGAQTESFNPSVFTLNEYHDLKYIIDKFENTLNEQELPTGAEKLKLVQTIKAAGEVLKRDLKNVFIKSMGSGEPSAVEAPGPSTVATSGPSDVETPSSSTVSTGGPSAVEGPGPSTTGLGVDIQGRTPTLLKRSRGRPRKILGGEKTSNRRTTPVSAPSGRMEAPSFEVGSLEKYKEMLPKEENKDKSLEYLKKNKQYTDMILHPDYGKDDFYSPSDESLEVEAKRKIARLEKLKIDAQKYEDSKVIDKIEQAISKMKSFYET